MKPHPVGDLKFVRGTHRSPYGLIVSEWQRNGTRFDWQITMPPNTMATAYVPASDLQGVLENGRPAIKAIGLREIRYEKGAAVLELESGKYRFRSNLR